MRFYKLCALLGTLIIVFDIGLSLMRIQSFESIVTEVFESIVKTQMEIDGLQQELNHIDKVLELSAQTKEDGSLKVDDIEYSAYEVERLKNEQSNIRLYTQEKKLDLAGLSGKKKHVMNDVRILFFLSLIFLVVGTLLATFGYLAWYFRIELFEDRRKNPR